MRTAMKIDVSNYVDIIELDRAKETREFNKTILPIAKRNYANGMTWSKAMKMAKVEYKLFN